ncbi:MULTISPECIES: aspartate aminotransferase family protein [Chryseobacterium]|uniref:Acetylornithine/N-succinyldiaminopimelate aminotransferase n=1 Tax=Chryseobacterium camelliae TaxID=1265445 RepID=A0ABU0TFM2_9FLAO|nr:MULTISPECIES: aminotransferase class III-fold pyridoxal phosphate-dependent enzyme [Chryseobacterium]MDT3406435.1 acetylornithine/N-succinyldiaminopimelate aminotransferase [Pseudacidovorax intermedius]MDQ1095766.1 acetylornithine/N-succinyldiaminopimelate aminotransferase [Chryseobacterium camelliae]MDQ1099703.1 acetylornithine/N-succinyldiaminopimelate aminotransferase [Chryseobacterium sp. SORGH_AS_1048]MDR6087051.1 acetylornithine/N-succinyldiaminopimelate aminotransferase [Chryseobacter
MNLFNVYPLFNINPVKAQGSFLWDDKGQQYLDFYGGHAVISIGHNHPHYQKTLKEQLDKISFYSNSVQNELQTELAEKLGRISGYEDYSLFLCNSGAEANENALKLASFHNGKSKVVYFSGSFHGRTSAAVSVTDNPKIVAPVNYDERFIRSEWNNTGQLEDIFEKEGTEISSVIIEGIQGVGGVMIPDAAFLMRIKELCQQYDAVLILDEVQSGYGRSGYFFAHQEYGIQPDLITTAKGMGNGFPIGGVLIHPEFQATNGLLGTTFGGNHLACAAAIAVLDVMKDENLMENARIMGDYIEEKIKMLPHIRSIRRKGLMIGIELDRDCAEVRSRLLYDHHIFTGNSNDKAVLRILPALNIKKEETDLFINALKTVLEGLTTEAAKALTH